MGLFSNTQLNKINEAAKKSNASLPTNQKISTSSINKELAESSNAVLEYFADSKSILITTPEQLHNYIDECIKAKITAIDTETTGLDRVKDCIVGISLYYPGGTECYIPIKHLVPLFDTPYKNQLTYEEVGKELQRLVDSKVKMIFANADFDLAMIYKDFHVDMCDVCYYDVIIAWRCIKEDEKKNGLKELYNKYVLKGQGEPRKFSDFFSPKLFPYCKPEIAKLYAANDAKITYELYRWQLPFITKGSKACQKYNMEYIANLVWDIEFPLIKVCQRIHRIGIYIDPDTAKVLNKRYAEIQKNEMEKLADMVQEVIDNNPSSYNSFTNGKQPFTTGKEFNPQSQPQVKYLLYDLMQIPKTDGKGSESTGKAVLDQLNLPITNQILKVRSNNVLINTFVKKMPNATTPDHRIHAQMKQLGAACIVGNTIVSTDEGYRTIEEIYESTYSQEVENHIDLDDLRIINKDSKSENADSVIKYENYQTIKLQLEFGIEIEGTFNHPIMVSKYSGKDISTKLRSSNYKRLTTLWDDRYFKNLSDIEVGDIVEIPCNYTYHAEYQPTNLNLIHTSHTLHKDAILPEFYTEDFAEFLGMYHADGSSRIHDGTYTVRLHNDDFDVSNRFIELCQNLFNIIPVRHDETIRQHEAETSFSSKATIELSNILVSGALNKRIPKAIWKSPQSVIKSYIKGMTLDSTVYVDNSNGDKTGFTMSIINEQDVHFVQIFLLSIGIYCSLRKYKTREHMAYRLKFNADNYVRFRDTIGFIESKKYMNTNSCKKLPYSRRRIGNSIYAKVKSISYSHNDVYDLHVPDTHSFISNGVISHNTGRLSSADPNLMNIPSHANDVRHMFRATPATDIIVDCEDDEDSRIHIDLSLYDSVPNEMGELIKVHDLEIGDKVTLTDEYNNKVLKHVIYIKENNKDLSRCELILGE